MLTMTGITKQINGKMILNQLSCEMRQRCLLITGESGSGKSTLAKIIAGLDSEFEGELYMNHISRAALSQKAWLKKIQYVPQYQRATLDAHQTVAHILKTPLKNFKFERSSYERRINTVLKQCLLSPELLQRRVGTLSGGQFQRLWIAKALIVEPEILILDEATTNLDVINETRILDMLQQQTLHLIVISHDAYVMSRFEGEVLRLGES